MPFKTPLQMKQDYQEYLVNFCLHSPLNDILVFFDISHSIGLWHEHYPIDYHQSGKQCGQYNSDKDQFTSCGECRTFFKAVSIAAKQRNELVTLFSCTLVHCPICASRVQNDQSS